MSLISKLAPNWLTNVEVIDLGHVHTVPIDYRSVPKPYRIGLLFTFDPASPIVRSNTSFIDYVLRKS